MATKRSARTPYRWANGSYHTRPENTGKKSAKKPGMATYSPAKPPKPMLTTLTGPGGKPAVKNPPPLAPVQPEDPNVVNQQVVANRDIAVGDAYGTFQQGNLDQQYGFGAGGAANPYSDAAKLQVNYERSKLGTTGSYASAGQYNSGAYGRAQNENARNYDMSYDAARRAYDQASGNLKFDKIQRYANAGTGIDDAKFNALLKSL